MPRVQNDPLTDKQVKALVPGEIPIDVRDGEVRGLIITVLPSGRKQFTVRYRIRGTQRRHMLGEYPALSLAKARKFAREAQVSIDNGHDPAGERQVAKAKRVDTVGVLADEYLAKHARKFKRTAAEDERILNVDVLPKWREMSVRELTRRDVRALVERVAARAPIMANRVLAVIRKMLNFAVDHDWIDANPAARVKKPSPERSRDRVLTAEEIRRVWRLLSRLPVTSERPAPGRKRAIGPEGDPLCPISAAMASLLKMRLMTAQRGGEVAHMRWADLSLPGKDDKQQVGWWTIPGEHTKNGEAHRVPLTADAVALIKAQIPEDKSDCGEFVFTGRGGAMVLDRAKKAPAAIASALKIDFRGHDLRRTAATNMAAAGVSRDHIARVLNHVEGGARATKVYDRYAYDWEKRAALDAWERRLKAILLA
jgi:integrase